MAEYLKPLSVKTISAIRKNVTFLAGGTDIYALLSDGIGEDKVYCDISFLKELTGIRKKGNKIVIGALSTFTEIRQNSFLKKHAGCLVEAAESVGSPQIRT